MTNEEIEILIKHSDITDIPCKYDSGYECYVDVLSIKMKRLIIALYKSFQEEFDPFEFYLGNFNADLTDLKLSNIAKDNFIDNIKAELAIKRRKLIESAPSYPHFSADPDDCIIYLELEKVLYLIKFGIFKGEKIGSAIDDLWMEIFGKSSIDLTTKTSREAWNSLERCFTENPEIRVMYEASGISRAIEYVNGYLERRSNIKEELTNHQLAILCVIKDIKLYDHEHFRQVLLEYSNKHSGKTLAQMKPAVQKLKKYYEVVFNANKNQHTITANCDNTKTLKARIEAVRVVMDKGYLTKEEIEKAQKFLDLLEKLAPQ